MAYRRQKENAVYFGQRGKTLMGWVHQSTPTRYLIWYRTPRGPRTVWRRKDRVRFVASGKPGRLNPCPTRANVNTGRAGAVREAIKRYREFHGRDPRRVPRINVKWPESLFVLGPCTQINYLSDKDDGELREYYHEFETPPLLFAAGRGGRSGRKRMLILIGEFNVEEAGITG